MIYARSPRWDYDHWESLGNPGWGWDDVLGYFLRSEANAIHRDSPVHGTDGPLHITNLRSPSPINDAFLAACESRGYPFKADMNAAPHEGCYHVQVTQYDGQRHSLAAAYIHPNLDRTNLDVRTRAQVSRLTFDGKRCTGVEFRRGDRIVAVRARCEVIVSAGAFGTPQILLASGLGPGDHLQELGITPIVDIGGVGQNLADHISALLIWKARANRRAVRFPRGSPGRAGSWPDRRRYVRRAPLHARWAENGTGRPARFPCRR